MSDKLPPQCRGLCPFDTLPDDIIPEGLLLNCRGPKSIEGAKTNRVTINVEDGSVIRVEGSMQQLGEVSCTNIMAKEQLVQPYLED